MPIVTIRDILDGKYGGESITIRGWIYRKREGKQTIFLVVRDSSGAIQYSVKKKTSSIENKKV